MPIDLNKLRSLRTESGLTQTQLGEAAEMPQSSIARLEAGKKSDIRVSTLENLAKALKVQPEELLLRPKKKAKQSH